MDAKGRLDRQRLLHHGIDRVTIPEWNRVVLNEEDTIIYNGNLRQLIGKKIGPGVIEVTMLPLKNGESQ